MSSPFDQYANGKNFNQRLKVNETTGTTAVNDGVDGAAANGSYEGTYTLGETGLVTGDSGTAVLLGSDGKVNLGDITGFENADTAGYDIRIAFKPTDNYGAGTAREVWRDMLESGDGIEVAYETGNLEITHGSETYQIATTYTAGEIYRLILSYNASTKLLEVYQNNSLLGSNTFTNALVMPTQSAATGEFWPFSENLNEYNSGTEPTITGNPVISSDQSKNYTKSLYLDGSSYLSYTIPAIGTQDFTVRFWFRIPNATQSRALVLLPNNYLIYTTNNFLVLFDGSSNLIISPANVANDTWQHAELARTSARGFDLYLDGVYAGNNSANPNLTGTSLSVGEAIGSVQDTIGYIQDVNLLIGSAIHSGTGSFTPPGALLSDPVYTVGGQRTVDELNFKEGPTDAADVADDYTTFTGGVLMIMGILKRATRRVTYKATKILTGDW